MALSNAAESVDARTQGPLPYVFSASDALSASPASTMKTPVVVPSLEYLKHKAPLPSQASVRALNTYANFVRYKGTQAWAPPPGK